MRSSRSPRTLNISMTVPAMFRQAVQAEEVPAVAAEVVEEAAEVQVPEVISSSKKLKWKRKMRKKNLIFMRIFIRRNLFHG